MMSNFSFKFPWTKQRNKPLKTKIRKIVTNIEVEGKGSQTYSDERGINSGWKTHNAIYRWGTIEIYAWNLHNFTNECHPNKLNKNF